jgi:cell division transport system permease protein
MGCFALLVFNINLNLKQLDQLNKIVVDINEDCESEEEIDRIKTEILALSNTKKIRFISKEETLQNFQEQFKSFFTSEDLFERIKRNDENPLPHSIEIEYDDINEIGTLDYQLRCIPGIGAPKNQVDIAEFLKNMINIIMLVFVWFLAIIFIIAIFIILNTVRLSVHSRRNELIIMRYIGATNSFIMIPFLLEGVIIGLISGVIAYIAQAYVYTSVVVELIKMNTGFVGSLIFMPFSDVNLMFFFGLILVGMLCGLLGSGLSSRKYLKA